MDHAALPLYRTLSAWERGAQCGLLTSAYELPVLGRAGQLARRWMSTRRTSAPWMWRVTQTQASQNCLQQCHTWIMHVLTAWSKIPRHP